MIDNMDGTNSLDDVIWVQGDPGDPASRDTNSESNDNLTIGALAREFNITLRAIRFYESKGLLKPRRDGKTRVYSPADRAQLALILKGKHLGFTLSEIRALIAAKTNSRTNDNDATPLGMSHEQCSRQIDTLERQKCDIEDAIAELRRVVTPNVPHPVHAIGA